MIYAAILAGGVGKRFGSSDIPKQFLEIKNKPIIIYTIEKFLVNDNFEKIIVLTPKEWIEHTKDIVKKYLNAEKVVVIEGGETRNDTIMNAINYIESEGNLNDDTIIITHDSVRPFVTHRIIEDNIKAVKEFGACDTVIEATDTIVESNNNSFITSIPERKYMYQGQTPQSFKALELKETFLSLTDNEKTILTDAAKIYVLKNKTVQLVKGETYNIKITYPYDLRIARSLLEETEND